MSHELGSQLSMLNFRSEFDSNPSISLGICSEFKSALGLMKRFSAGVVVITSDQMNGWLNVFTQDNLPATSCPAVDSLIAIVQIMFQVAI